MIAPSTSCSSGGSLRASSRAFSKIVAMTNTIHKTPAHFEPATPLPNPSPQGGRGKRRMKTCEAPSHA
jgi:hypothetical protein